MKRDISTKDEKKRISGKAKIAVICFAAVLTVALITLSVGLVLYFNSPAYAAGRLVDAVKNEDGEEFEELIRPEERDYISSLLQPLDMQLGDVPSLINKMLPSSEEGTEVETVYTKDGETARYTAVITKEKGDYTVELTFKRQDGKWYFSPTRLVEATPIKTALKIMDAVKRSDGKAFFDCVLPSEARIIKLGAALAGLNEDKILEQFLKSSGGFGDNGAFPEIKDIEFEEDRIVALIAQKDSNDIKLTFAQEEGKWYVSVLDMINPFS